MLRSVQKNNRPHRRRCGAVTGRENLTAPLNLTVSQCDCALVWTAGTVKPSNQGEEEIQQYGTKGEGQTKRNSGVRDSKQRTWSMPGKPDKARTRRRSGDLARKPLNRRPNGNTQISCQALREESDNPRGGGGGGGAQLSRSDGHREISKEHRKIHEKACEPSPSGRLRARNWRLTYLAAMKDNWENHEKGRGRTMDQTHLRQRWGTRAPERKVSLTRSNPHLMKGRTESVQPQGGPMNAKRIQTDHPVIRDEGTE